MTKMEHDYVTICLMRRIKDKDLKEDFSSLALAISKETEIPLEKCKEIMKKTDAVEMMSVFIEKTNDEN